MEEFNPIPQNLHDVLVNTLTDIGLIADMGKCPKLSLNALVEISKAIGIPAADENGDLLDGTLALAREAGARFKMRKWWQEYRKTHPRGKDQFPSEDHDKRRTFFVDYIRNCGYIPKEKLIRIGQYGFGLINQDITQAIADAYKADWKPSESESL